MIHTWPLRDKLTAFAVALLIAVPLFQMAPLADAAPPAIGGTCGGQNWRVEAPVDCHKTTVIDGVAVTVHVVQAANGDTTITYTLNHSVPYDTLIHATSHLNASDSGGPSRDPRGTVSAGSTGPVSLFIHAALCGQIDIRWKIDSKPGRVVGPWINNQTCRTVVTTTTTTPSTTTPPGGSTSVPTVPPTSPTTAGTVVRTVPPGTTPLPPTGNGHGPAAVGGAALAAGAALVLIARRRRVSV